MSPRRTWLFAALVGAVGTFLLALRAQALVAAKDAVEREALALERTDAELHELLELRTQREVVAEEKRPTQDVIAQVNAVLRDAGIPTTRLKNLEPDADVPVAGRYRIQTLRLSLDQLSLRDVGAFLAAWRDAMPIWTPRSIELVHANLPDGSDGGFDVRIVIAASYLSDAPTETTR